MKYFFFVKKPAGTDQITALLCVTEGQAKSTKACNIEQIVRQFFGDEFSHWRVTIIRSLEQSVRNKPIFAELYTEAEGQTLLRKAGKYVVSYSVKP